MCNGLPPKSNWDKAETIAKIAIALVTVTWSALSFSLVTFYQRKTAERQAEAARVASQSQRGIAEAQLGSGLLPLLVKGTDSERARALMVLSSVAPEPAEKISRVLTETGGTPSEREFAGRVNVRSKESGLESSFAELLSNARSYRGFGLSAEADREYRRALKVIPRRLSTEVDRDLARKAEEAYSSARFDEAAALFEQLFARVVR